MIVYAVLKQFDSEIPRMLWAVDKRDCAVFAATLIATVTLGVQNGLAVGAVLSLGRLLQESAAPRVSRLGKMPGTRTWINFGRHSKTSVEEPGVAVLRFESHLYFANALHFRDEVLRASFPWRRRGDFRPMTPADYEATPPPPAAPSVPGMGPALQPEAVIVDCSAVTRVDATAVDVLESIPREVKRNAKRLRELRVQRLRRALEQIEDGETNERLVAGGHDRLCVCETTTNQAGEEFLTWRLECSCVLRTIRGIAVCLHRTSVSLAEPWFCCLECPCCICCGGTECVEEGGCCGKPIDPFSPPKRSKAWSSSSGGIPAIPSASTIGGLPAPVPTRMVSVGLDADEELAFGSPIELSMRRSQSIENLLFMEESACGGAVSAKRAKHMGEMTKEFLEAEMAFYRFRFGPLT